MKFWDTFLMIGKKKGFVVDVVRRIVRDDRASSLQSKERSSFSSGKADQLGDAASKRSGPQSESNLWWELKKIGSVVQS